VIATTDGGNSGADCERWFVIKEQRTFSVKFQVVGDEPSELGVKGDELYVGFGLTVARRPRVSPGST